MERSLRDSRGCAANLPLSWPGSLELFLRLMLDLFLAGLAQVVVPALYRSPTPVAFAFESSCHAAHYCSTELVVAWVSRARQVRSVRSTDVRNLAARTATRCTSMSHRSVRSHASVLSKQVILGVCGMACPDFRHLGYHFANTTNGAGDGREAEGQDTRGHRSGR